MRALQRGCLIPILCGVICLLGADPPPVDLPRAHSKNLEELVEHVAESIDRADYRTLKSFLTSDDEFRSVFKIQQRLNAADVRGDPHGKKFERHATDVRIRLFRELSLPLEKPKFKTVPSAQFKNSILDAKKQSAVDVFVSQEGLPDRMLFTALDNGGQWSMVTLGLEIESVKFGPGNRADKDLNGPWSDELPFVLNAPPFTADLTPPKGWQFVDHLQPCSPGLVVMAYQRDGKWKRGEIVGPYSETQEHPTCFRVTVDKKRQDLWSYRHLAVQPAKAKLAAEHPEKIVPTVRFLPRGQTPLEKDMVPLPADVELTLPTTVIAELGPGNGFHKVTATQRTSYGIHANLDKSTLMVALSWNQLVIKKKDLEKLPRKKAADKDKD